MKPLAFLLVLAGASSVSAQTLVLKNGTTVPANGLVRDGDMIKTSVTTSGGGQGQVGFPVTDVAELDLPQPAGLSAATDLIAKGLDNPALTQLEPILAYQKTIRDLPGNWWAKAALLKVSALCAVNRQAEAKTLVDEITANSKDPEVQTATKLQIALITKFDNPREAIAAYDAVIKQSSDPQTLSQAWIAAGNTHLAQREFDEALLAYLTVAVFFPEHNPLVPKALWGSAQAYTKLKDVTNATKTFKELVSKYPDSPEAALAKVELKKKEDKT